ncbi:MAG: ATP-binding protein [Clostridia bacterium]|nr:ATP-binding protein [Clostridia bacterium]
MEISKILKSELSDEYFALKEQNELKFEQQKEFLYNAHPRLKEIDTEISLTALRCARKIADKSRTVEDVSAEMMETLNRLKAEREAYIAKNNIDPSYINPRYSCEICKDTGYVNGKMCKCLKSRLVQKLYERSNMSEENKKCTFSKFKLGFYSDKDENNLGISPLENIKEVLIACKKYCENFSKSKQGIYISGNAGVGKTYLSCCIANYLISRGNTVLYQTAYRLFGFLEDYKFMRVDRTESAQLYDYIYNCDMLIIDDLGTEFSTSFAKAAFFDLINTRAENKKSTVINSNLSLTELESAYSMRVKSRINSSFLLLHIFGDDIREKI